MGLGLHLTNWWGCRSYWPSEHLFLCLLAPVSCFCFWISCSTHVALSPYINELILVFINYYVCLSAKICWSIQIVLGSRRESGPVFFFLHHVSCLFLDWFLCAYPVVYTYIISSIQVSNFMSCDTPSGISNCMDCATCFLKGDVAIHAKHKTIYICLYSLTAVTQEPRYTLCLLQPVSEQPLAGGSVSNKKCLLFWKGILKSFLPNLSYFKVHFMVYWLIFWAYLSNKNHFYKYWEQIVYGRFWVKGFIVSLWISGLFMVTGSATYCTAMYKSGPQPKLGLPIAILHRNCVVHQSLTHLGW